MSVFQSASPLVESTSILVHRPSKIVFRFIGEQFFNNYPRLSPEVQVLQQLDPGPIQVGTRARQVRIDQGRRSESVFVISKFEPDRRISLDGLSYRYRCGWEMGEIGSQTSTLIICSFELPQIETGSHLKGLVRAAVSAGIERVLSRLKSLVEADSGHPPACGFPSKASERDKQPLSLPGSGENAGCHDPRRLSENRLTYCGRVGAVQKIAG